MAALLLAGFVSATAAVAGSAAHLHATGRWSVTSYPNFANACIASVEGYVSKPEGPAPLTPRLGHFLGSCSQGVKPLVLGVTHENASNNHKGARNNNPNIHSYMADFDYGADFGRWFNVEILTSGNPPIIALRLDTKKFDQINVTGWPLRYGHLFVGLSDQTATSALTREVVVEFDLRIQGEAGPTTGSFNGRRVLIGAVGKWKDAAPRTNLTHFLEVNIDQTDGFPASYGERKYPLCADAEYDRCFYSDGHYSEGREISYWALSGSSPAKDSAGWSHISLNLTRLFQQLKWVSAPANWDDAKIDGLYFAIESTGITATTVELMNYNLYTLGQ